MPPPSRLDQIRELSVRQAYAQPKKAARRLRRLDAAPRLDDVEQATRDGIAQGLTVSQRCLDCGAALTDPDSRQRRYGPDCWAKRGGVPAPGARSRPSRR